VKLDRRGLASSIKVLFGDLGFADFALDAFEVLAFTAIVALLADAFLVVLPGAAAVFFFTIFGLEAAFLVVLDFVADDAFFFATLAFDFTVPATGFRDFALEALLAFALVLMGLAAFLAGLAAVFRVFALVFLVATVSSRHSICWIATLMNASLKVKAHPADNRHREPLNRFD